MNHLKIPRLALAGALLSLAVAAPMAQAAPKTSTDLNVCNQATPVSLGGDLVATDGDPVPPARYQENLKVKPGNGKGLVNAASHSPALSLCGAPVAPVDPVDPTDPTDDSGSDDDTIVS